MNVSAVLLDRDGVITRKLDGYVKSLDELEMVPGAAAAIARLTAARVPVIVVTNQSVINRGLASEETLTAIHVAMTEAVTREGGRIDAIYHCPHRPDEGCDCRKPRPGMLLRAAEQFKLDLALCVLVGDGDSDMEAAANAGCPAIKIGPDVPDLNAAVDLILGH